MIEKSNFKHHSIDGVEDKHEDLLQFFGLKYDRPGPLKVSLKIGYGITDMAPLRRKTSSQNHHWT